MQCHWAAKIWKIHILCLPHWVLIRSEYENLTLVTSFQYPIYEPEILWFLSQISILKLLQGSSKHTKRELSSPRLTVSSVQVYGQEKQLVLREVEVKNVADPLMTEDTQCDVVCLVYDCNHPKSFEYVAEIFLVSTSRCFHSQLQKFFGC